MTAMDSKYSRSSAGNTGRLLLTLILILGVFFTNRAESAQTAPNAPGQETADSVRRVNVPYTTITRPGIPVPERAIFWYGEVGPSDDNYTDVRLIYNDDELVVTYHVFDRILFYDTPPVSNDLTAYDAVTLYLNLDGRAGATPGPNAYRFEGALSFSQPRANYQKAFQGNGSGWTAASVSFTTNVGTQMDGINDSREDAGWNISFYIPYTSLGLTGKPAEGTVWGIAAQTHDRDLGGTLPDLSWPDAPNLNSPSTWGELRFGLPTYSPPPANPGDLISIRQGLNGAVVPDGHVGGDSICAGIPWSNIWAQWGGLNYDARELFVVQNQWNLGDFPCFSKYYLTFPLDDLPPGQAISSATMTVYQFGNANQGGSYDPNDPPEPSIIQVFTIEEVWNEATLTWNNAPLAVENVSRAQVDPLPLGPPWPNVPRQFDLSQAVADAYAAGQPLRLALYAADNELHSGKYFRSSDFSTPSARPLLEVQMGIVDGFTFSLDQTFATIQSGETAVFQASLQPLGNFNETVTLTVSDPFAQLDVTPKQTAVSLPNTVNINITDLSGSGLYEFTITAAGGGFEETETISVFVADETVYLPVIQR